MHIPHTIQVWGIASFVSVRVFPQPSTDKRKSAPHFLFFVTTVQGAGAVQPQTTMTLLLSVLISLLVALLGRNRNIGYGWGLFFCLCLSPIIGLIIILCSKKKKVVFHEADVNTNN